MAGGPHRNPKGRSPIYVEVEQGKAPPEGPRPPKMVNRCDRCFAQLYEAERGRGSTSLACPKHGFLRMILTIPADLENWALRNPETATRYVAWLKEQGAKGEGVVLEAPGRWERLTHWLMTWWR